MKSRQPVLHGSGADRGALLGGPRTQGLARAPERYSTPAALARFAHCLRRLRGVLRIETPIPAFFFAPEGRRRKGRATFPKIAAGPAPCQAGSLFLALALLLGAGSAWADEPGLADSLEAHVRLLAGLGSRVSGYPGAKAAADYLEAQLRAAGIAQVYRRPFQVPVPMEEGAGLVLADEGQELALYGMWPDLARTPTLPGEGLAGSLVYGGRGRPEDLAGLELEGRVVALEYNCGADWVWAFDLGAAAVVFLAPETTHRKEGERKFLSTPADLPRFYAPPRTSQILRQRLAGQPGGVPVRLRGRMSWQAVRAETVVGVVPGADPGLGRQAVLLGAYYDAISPVPAQAPGAEQSCGVAAWLELARRLGRQPPRRTAVLVATAGHFQALAGMRDLVALLRRAEKAGASADPLEERLRGLEVAYYLGFDLSSHTRQLSLVQAGDPYRVRTILPPVYGPIARLTQEYEAEVLQGRMILGGELKPLLQRRLVGQLPERVPVEGAVAALAGYLGLTLVSAGDERAAFDSPVDLPEAVEFSELEEQTRFAIWLAVQLLGDPGAGPQVAERADAFGTLRGRVVSWGPHSFEPDQPVAGAWVRVRSLHKTMMGVRLDPVALADSEGRFALEGLEARTLYLKPVSLEAYLLDQESGEVRMALDQGAYGSQHYPSQVEMDYLDKEVSLLAFSCRPLVLFDLFDPRYLFTLEQGRLLEAGQEAPLSSYGLCLPPTASEVRRSGYYYSIGAETEKVGVALAPPGARVKLVMTTGRYGLGRRLLLLNSAASTPEGTGFAVGEHSRVGRSAFRVAGDLCRLDAARLQGLEEHGIHSPLLERLHGQALARLQQARAALAGRDWRAFADLSHQAWALEARAYGAVQDLVADVVRGAVFFLFLLLPFAFFGERLLLGSADLRRQLLGSAVLFAAGFWGLRWAHPAFGLTLYPSLVLVGFLALALSLAVAGLGLGRLNFQLRTALSPVLARHRADIRRRGILFRSLLVGVAQMRRRPWRTGLTCATLALLAFSLISFTSVREGLRVHRTSLDPAGPAQGLLVRLPGWEGLEANAWEYLRLRFGEECTLPRVWYLRPGLLWGEGDRSAQVEAVLGLEAGETRLQQVEQALAAGRWFAPGEFGVCLLSAPQARDLGIGAADLGKARVRFLGGEYTAIGILESGRFEALRDLDGAPLTPLDREAQQPAEERAGRTRQGLEPAFVHLGAGRLLVVPAQVAARWGEDSRLAGVAVRLEGSPEQALARVEELAQELGLDLSAAAGGRRYLVAAVGVQSFSGQRGVWVPLLLAALIALDTMLGSVYERLPEIGVFNAIGLAPGHVAGLFLAEAGVYAVLSGGLGYLLGQGMATLGWVCGLFPGLTVNYSSLSAVATLAGLGLVVLLSALYPARQAARICVPGIERRWQLPPARDGVLELAMPFTLIPAEARALVAFLAEYLHSCDEQSIGAAFYAEGLRCGPEGAAARLWLAPFDQGLMQELELRVEPEPDGRFCRILVRLARRAGDAAAGQRGNRAFLDELRRQFLVWRALDPAARAGYAREEAR